MEPAVKIACEAARALVPSYLDGELSEAQASPLRAHLLDCPACRETAKEGKALSRWFVAESEVVTVPAGFAARVARRAFAGDPGLLVPEPPPLAPRRALLPFLLAATAVAAAALLALALALKRESLPRASGLDALEVPPWVEAEAQGATVDR
jgi:anti-sigma factor RsiW